MSLSTYSDLQSAIGDHLARTDLTSVIPDFIKQSEAIFNRLLRHPAMQAEYTLTFASGAAPLPSDYLEWIGVRYQSTGLDLRYVEPNSEHWVRGYRPNDNPSIFSIVSNKVQTRPAATSAATLYYYQSVPALSVTNTTNWLLTLSPDLYLDTALAEAHKYLKDEARAAAFASLVLTAIQSMNGETATAKVERRPGRNAEVQDKGGQL